MTDPTSPKEYPTNYPSDAVGVLDAMSFTDGKAVRLVGSMAIRSQQYAADYDGIEVVRLSEPSDKEALSILSEKFKGIIKRLRSHPNSFIGDIKAGSVEEWRVIPADAKLVGSEVVGFNSAFARGRINELVRDKVITEAEAKEAHSLVRDVTPTSFALAKAVLKYHIVRWTPGEVLAGHKKLRDGRTYTLEEAFSSPSISKLDVISFVENSRYTEFSMVYEFFNNGRPLNPYPIDMEAVIREDILRYQHERNYVKVLKREFVLAKLNNDKELLEKLSVILNSDVGRLYQIKSDAKVLVELLENREAVDDKKVRFEIDQFKKRLSNVYSFEPYLREENEILGELNSALKAPKTNLLPALKRLYDSLEDVLATPAVRGGTVKNIVESRYLNNPSKSAPQNAAHAYAIMEMARHLSHYYDRRDPILALGYRTIYYEIYRALPVIRDPSNAPATTDPAHEEAVDYLVNWSLGKDIRATAGAQKGELYNRKNFIRDAYTAIEPTLLDVQKKGLAQTFNQASTYLSRDPFYA